MKINWPMLLVITSFLYFVTGVWADMPEPFNVNKYISFLIFCSISVFTTELYKKRKMNFELELSKGKQNSLGETLKVVDFIKKILKK